MKTFLRKFFFATALVVATGVVPTHFESTATACPGCKTANETEERRPKAYMYSILFMLGMPATVFTGFSIAFYRMSKKAAAAQLAELATSEAPENDEHS